MQVISLNFENCLDYFVESLYTVRNQMFFLEVQQHYK